ncbi:[acyl-carrier-protein] S-malonyltransferase [Cryobacterium mesophilum]|uniref:[acyl-carrier-protein] S-malonyltransferase n=1 Tax=Terrimesophilobacter mesophilus TaxID=433647 RepID=A0A4R8V6J1_9MICO|nr:ACP S-malonyltransferase [Terrimesophilobacter mesophilus]MBB5631792.1 [acyl-carrier-protein] S-malonyltransferase [Terrimesophilobacter mesophilus]TFB78711.1 ACP S-malonyltransferase [Terrimesophilobacter mesophilus]
MIVVVCPGQGSQTPGFLTPWLEVPGLEERLAGYSDAAGIDLATHGTVSDADTIRDTKVAQPLIVAAGLLTLYVLLQGRRDQIGGIAGHSVGELTAAAAAGILTETEAMSLVAERGRAMADAAALTPTGMSAVIGADETELLSALHDLGLEPANFNGGGQIVVAGALDALEKLRETPPAGARVIPLQVAGAFHTRYMAPAVERLEAAASGLSAASPTLPIWTNRDGHRVSSGSEYLDLLVGQVSSPVRWDRCMESFAEAGVTGVVEVAPAGALVGLAKRGLKGVPSVAVKTPEDIQSAIEMIENS